MLKVALLGSGLAASTRCAGSLGVVKIYILHVSFALQLVDTKSIHNTTLLHFLERTVVKLFPDMETFLDELAKPAEAYRGTISKPLQLCGALT